ncbi:MAG: phosphotransferase [Spirochaetes bacterium]|nr:phosphotransferase [Spirochaetota bacterium]MBN2771214.1 phosphotransferase [Spirochaetota bacterium]
MNTQIAKEICKKYLKIDPLECYRFTTGLRSYSFYLQTETGKYVVKICRQDDLQSLKNNVYWMERLKTLNLKIPCLVNMDLNCQTPFVIYTYIEGDDLGNVYQQLSESDKKEIAQHLVNIQREVKRLGQADGYGYLSNMTDPNKKNCWLDVIKEHINRSKNRLRANGFFPDIYADEVEKLLPDFCKYFETISPVAFFDDATTKNVLIHDGKFSGIIDFDNLCFGDDLYTVALTKMSLLNSKYGLTYIDYWIKLRGINRLEQAALDLYTLIFCLDFMSEMGMCFNKEQPPKVREQEVEHFKKIYDEYMTKIIINR